jgi:hypothetical protein
MPFDQSHSLEGEQYESICVNTPQLQTRLETEITQGKSPIRGSSFKMNMGNNSLKLKRLSLDPINNKSIMEHSVDSKDNFISKLEKLKK